MPTARERDAHVIKTPGAPKPKKMRTMPPLPTRRPMPTPPTVKPLGVKKTESFVGSVLVVKFLRSCSDHCQAQPVPLWHPHHRYRHHQDNLRPSPSHAVPPRPHSSFRPPQLLLLGLLAFLLRPPHLHLLLLLLLALSLSVLGDEGDAGDAQQYSQDRMSMPGTTCRSELRRRLVNHKRN